MGCDAWNEMLIDRLAGELDEEDSVLLEQHLDECPGCREEEQRLQEILEAQKTGPEWAPREGMLSGLLARMRLEVAGIPDRPPVPAAAGRPRIGRRFTGVFGFLGRPLPSYAALVLVLAATGGGFWIGRLDRTDAGQALVGQAHRDRTGTGGREIEFPAPPAPERTDRSVLRGDQQMVASSILEEIGFVPARADAVGLPAAAASDSL
jgi:anti-sigma factor RsiW